VVSRVQLEDQDMVNAGRPECSEQNIRRKQSTVAKSKVVESNRKAVFNFDRSQNFAPIKAIVFFSL
jgi:hypothetical protein